MKHNANRYLAEPVNRRGQAPTSARQPSGRHPLRAALVAALALACGATLADRDDPADHGSSPTQLRRFVDAQVGGIDKLKVPARDADIPVPRQPDGSVAYRYQTTEAKR